MRRILTGALLIALSLVLSLDPASSFARICSVSFDVCCDTVHSSECCSTECCNTGVPATGVPASEAPDCCFVIADETLFVPGSKIFPALSSVILFDLPGAETFFQPFETERSVELVGNSPDPPPLSGRDLLSLIERQLI